MTLFKTKQKFSHSISVGKKTLGTKNRGQFRFRQNFLRHLGFGCTLEGLQGPYKGE